MIQAGLVSEVESLIAYKHLPVMKTVGYSELFDYLEGKQSLEKSIELIKQHTRNFAKRQLTWFRNKGDYRWFDPSDSSSLLAHVKASIQQ